MLLKGKNIVIYGAGGSVGTTVAKSFANEGANVFLTEYKTERIKKITEQVIQNGGHAEFAKVDAYNQSQVEAHLEQLTKKHGTIDVSFNLVSMQDVQGFPLVELSMEQFIAPVVNAMKSQFITARAAANEMIKQNNGVILMLTANAAKKPCENVGGFGVACASIEALSRQLAAELGKYGIRVVCLRSAGSPDAKGVAGVFEQHADLLKISAKEFERQFSQKKMLKRLPKLNEIATAAGLLASDKASAITAAIINLTCGELAD